jgi:hypothetical protein
MPEGLLPPRTICHLGLPGGTCITARLIDYAWSDSNPTEIYAKFDAVGIRSGTFQSIPKKPDFETSGWRVTESVVKAKKRANK